MTEKLDQRSGVGALRGLAGNSQKEFLKRFVGMRRGLAMRRRRRFSFGNVQSATVRRNSVFAILTSD
jgi:hypothetical protein